MKEEKLNNKEISEMYRFYNYFDFKTIKDEEINLFRDLLRKKISIKDFINIKKRYVSLNEKTVLNYFSRNLDIVTLRDLLHSALIEPNWAFSKTIEVLNRTYTISVHSEDVRTIHWCLEDIHNRAEELAEDRENYKKEFDTSKFSEILEEVVENYGVYSGVSWTNFDDLIIKTKINK